MLSLLLPSELRLRFTPGLLVREGPRGITRLVPGPVRLRLIETPSGRRLVVDALNDSSETAPLPSTTLAHISRHIEGVRTGVRRRLSIVGVGFRATVVPANKGTGPALSLKLGYREERRVPLEPLKAVGVQVTPSRLEGRSKGTLIRVEGLSRERVNQVAADLRKLRLPDSYKGKGMQYDREKLILKKGKRELAAVSLSICQLCQIFVPLIARVTLFHTELALKFGLIKTLVYAVWSPCEGVVCNEEVFFDAMFLWQQP